MTDAETLAFLAQFERSAANYQRWPEWMRRTAYMAAARLPSAEAAARNARRLIRAEAAAARLDAMTPRERASLQLQGGK